MDIGNYENVGSGFQYGIIWDEKKKKSFESGQKQ